MPTILLADLLSDLDVSTIDGTKEKTTVHYKQQLKVSDSFQGSSVSNHSQQNFMLEVPEASVPAVEMCSEMSEAGMRSSARETE